MRPENQNTSSLKTRVIYGGVVGAFLGMIIGTMPGNDPLLGVIGLGSGAVIIAALAAVSHDFWESLVAAWELVRIAFWRW